MGFGILIPNQNLRTPRRFIQNVNFGLYNSVSAVGKMIQQMTYNYANMFSESHRR